MKVLKHIKWIKYIYIFEENISPFKINLFTFVVYICIYMQRKVYLKRVTICEHFFVLCISIYQCNFLIISYASLIIHAEKRKRTNLISHALRRERRERREKQGTSANSQFEIS